MIWYGFLRPWVYLHRYLVCISSKVDQKLYTKAAGDELSGDQPARSSGLGRAWRMDINRVRHRNPEQNEFFACRGCQFVQVNLVWPAAARRHLKPLLDSMRDPDF